ncbi:MAG: MoxR family ATPase [Kiritimatiellae bacterium]|nr:MoxR family ATPase [Kiritimatiellia bacterium]
MKSLITEPLGLYGWKRSEAVLLAALLSEEPLLLVGAHGCAKSFVLERLAEALGMEFRSYNASLINYDDLVGVPLPDATRTKLEYLSSPESIWDAEVVFMDEISRTRPELQNKLFPIIYEKRVQGRPLSRLVYRWAAMNPPPTDDELDEGGALYLGSEPLDAALADRFPYIMSVPDWDDLTSAEQKKVLADQFAGRHEFPVAIRELVAEARKRYEELVPELTPRLTPYIVTLVPKLHAAKYDVSTRRATMLLRCAIAVHAAREVLAMHSGHAGRVTLPDGDGRGMRLACPPPELYDSVRLALLNTLPDRGAGTSAALSWRTLHGSCVFDCCASGIRPRSCRSEIQLHRRHGYRLRTQARPRTAAQKASTCRRHYHGWIHG